MTPTTKVSLPTATEQTSAQPCRMGTPFPKPQQIIGVENANKVEELASYGYLSVIAKVPADGQKIFVASGMGVDLYKTDNYQLIKHFNVETRPDLRQQDLGISADGQRFFILNDNNLRLFTTDGKELLNMPAVSQATFSPDGKLLVLSDTNRFEIIQIDSQKTIYKWDSNPQTLHGEGPTFSEDGQTLVTWFGKRLWFWDASNWQKKREIWFEEPHSSRCSWGISRQASYLAIACDSEVNIWNLNTGNDNGAIKDLSNQELIPNQVVFSPDESIIGILEPGRLISTWNTVTKNRLSGHLKTDLFTNDLFRVLDSGDIIAFGLPKGQVATITGYRIPFVFRFLPEQNGLIFLNTILQSQTDVVGSAESCVFLFDQRPSCFNKSMLVIDKNNQYVAGDIFGTPNNPNSSKPSVVKLYKTSFEGNGEEITSFGVQLKYSTIELLGLITNDNLVFYTIWNTAYGTGTSIVFDYAQRSQLKQWKGFIRRIVYSDDYHYAAFFVQYDSFVELVIFDLVEKKVVHQENFESCTRWCNILDFSSDNSRLAYSAGNKSNSKDDWSPISFISLQEPFTTTPIQFNQQPLAISLSPNGKLLAVALGGGNINLIDPANGNVLAGWRGYIGQEVAALAFSIDGTLIASSTNDGIIKIWGIRQ